MEQANILIVDDEEGIRFQLKWALNKDYQVVLAADSNIALQRIREKRPNVVLLDIALSSVDNTGGLRLLDAIQEIDPTIKVVMITGHDTRSNALEAIARGAYDFYSKPIDLDEIRIVIKRALYIQALQRENMALRLKVTEESRSALIGKSPQMCDVIEMIEQISSKDNVTVLIQGESGTGKEVVAREIHSLSVVSGKFVTVDCGSIPAALIESELFGHEKGAFTSAHRSKTGKLEDAKNGTLFLDEIAELPLDLQVKFLRFLQQREIQRVGGLKVIPIHTRVIAATNRNLEAEVANGNFRTDLYFRLSVVTLFLPPLCERGNDIVLLANTYLNRYQTDFGKQIKGFTPEAVEAMMQHPWTGNVRELQNRILRGLVVMHGDQLTAEDMDFVAQIKSSQTLQDAKADIERKFVERALYQHQGNISSAADFIGVTRTTFYDLLKRHQIVASSYRNQSNDK